MARTKTTKRIPDWLTPTRYQGLSTLQTRQWIVLLLDRQRTQGWLAQRKVSKEAEGNLNAKFTKFIDTSQSLLVADEPGIFADAPDLYTDQIYGSIAPLSIGMAMQYIASHIVEHPNDRDSIEAFWRLMIGSDAGAFRNEHFAALGHALPSICVDLNFDRDRLKDAFVRWLASVKPVDGSNNTRAKRAVNVESWVTGAVIPLLDVEQWARWAGVVGIPKRQKVEFLKQFTPRQVTERMLDRGGSIRELVNQCLREDTISRLLDRVREADPGRGLSQSTALRVAYVKAIARAYGDANTPRKPESDFGDR